MKLSMLLGLAMTAALGVLALLPGGFASPSVASAAFDCDPGDTGTVRVDIIDDDTDNRITVSGSVVRFSPDTETGTGSDNVTDNGSEDDSSVTGRVTQNDACSTTGSSHYTVTLVDLPNSIDDECDVVDSSDSGDLSDSGTLSLELHVDCDSFHHDHDFDKDHQHFIPGPPAIVSFLTSPSGMTCGTSSNLTAFVRDGFGNVVPNGTLVSFQNPIGFGGTPLVPTVNGLANINFAVPTGFSGPTTITAFAGPFSAQTVIIVNCSTAAAAPALVAPAPVAPKPVAPAAPTAPTTVVLPRAGEGPMTDDSSSPMLPVGAGLILVAGLGIVAYWRLNASRSR